MAAPTTVQMQAPSGTGVTTFILPNGATAVVDANGFAAVPIQFQSFMLNAGWTVPQPGAGARNNITATVDPLATNDSSQDYGPGSLWINTVLNREWICVSAGVGAALWSFSGAVPGNNEPSGIVTQFGSSSGAGSSMGEEGNVYRFVSAAGQQPAATGADVVLAVFSIPANAFDGIGNRGITVTAMGSLGATANTKRIKLIFNPASAVVGSTVGAGGTVLADTGAITTNGGGWELGGNVFKYGAANSNTQLCTSNGAVAGSTHLGVSSPAASTAVENAAILVAVTGNATTATTDITLNWMEVNAMN